MKIRTNPDTDVAEVQVGLDQWINVDEAVRRAADSGLTLRKYLIEQYEGFRHVENIDEHA